MGYTQVIQGILFGDEDTGVEINYVKSKQTLWVTCHYDGGYVGMESVPIELSEFCRLLEIKPETLKKIAGNLCQQ